MILRRPGLDTLRALAILAVMLYHLTIFGELPIRILPVTWFGWMGVDLFFVLSGYLIGGQVLRPYRTGARHSISDFYRRRAWRILPAYLCVLALYVLVPPWREYPHLAPLWKYLTFTMNFGIRFDQRAFSQAWSLCVEEHFYLLLPLVVALFMRHPSARKTYLAFATLVLAGIALRAWLIVHDPSRFWQDIYYPTDTRLDGLIDGVALAVLETFRPHAWARLMRHGRALLLTGLACIGAVLGLFHAQDFTSAGSALWGVILGFPLLAFGLALLTASAAGTQGWLARSRVPGAQTLAALAFCLYLTHKSVAHLVMVHLPRALDPQGPLAWLLYAVACGSAAWLLHILVERPCLRLRDGRTRRLTAPTLEARMREDPPL